MKIGVPLLALVFSTAGAFLFADKRPQQATAFEQSLSRRLHAAARQMVADFKLTRYSHKTFIDRGRGICEVDCSGFIVALLQQIAPKHLGVIATAHKRPLAEDFYATFAREREPRPRGWMRIERVGELEPGDLIAWVKQEREPGDNTGHVMLVDGKPTADPPNRFRIRVLDSTLHGHAHDSRPEGKSGIGMGTIWLDVDGHGHPTGFRWKARDGKLHEIPIAIGRAVPFSL